MRIIFTILIAMSSLPLIAQLPDETNGRVPELDAFHKPIYSLWHEAWPSKDVRALKQLFPQIESAYTKLAAATLPGILRDKQERWNEKKEQLRSAVEEYRVCITGNDTARLLKAAEDVHMMYEQMVRIVRPVTKEIDEFHKVLYSLHHYGIPGKNPEMIRTNAEELHTAMTAVDTAALPKRWEKKKEQYGKSRALLSDGVKQYVEAVRNGKPFDILIKLESTVHSRYQMLEKVFE